MEDYQFFQTSPNSALYSMYTTRENQKMGELFDVSGNN